MGLVTKVLTFILVVIDLKSLENGSIICVEGPLGSEGDLPTLRKQVVSAVIRLAGKAENLMTHS